MTARAVLAAVLGLGGLVTAAVLLSDDVGPIARADAVTALDGPTAHQLDTLSVRGRRVVASAEGTVEAVGADEVWVTMGDDAFPLRFPGPHGLDVEDRVLVVGRLRARGGRRWLAVSDWAVVSSSVAAPGFAPDTLGAAGVPPPESGL